MDLHIGKQFTHNGQAVTTVVAVTPLGLNYRVEMANGYVIVVPTSYVRSDAR